MGYQALGWVLLGLGLVDLLINTVNGLSLILRKQRFFGACLLNVIMRPEGKWRELGNSLDVLLSFTLVAVVIGLGWIQSMAPQWLKVWNICVVFNVMGAGLGRFGKSLKNIATQGSPG